MEEKQITIDANLTTDDLKNLSALIEASTKRGTWSAAELTYVGALYDKLLKVMAEIQAHIDAKKVSEDK
jgi:hypothetical protein